MRSLYVKATSSLERMLLQTYQASSQDLGIYRILYGLAMLLFVSPHLQYQSPLPKHLYSPPFSLMAFSAEPLSPTTLTALRYTLTIALAMLTIGYRTCLMSLLVASLLVVVNSSQYSAGKINHSILLVLVPLTLAFSAWGSRYSLDALSDRKKLTETSIPLGMLALLIAMAMATAGWAKWKSGWLSLEGSAVKHYVYDFWVIRNRDTAALRPLVAAVPQWIWEFKDWGTVGFELAGLVAIFRRRWFFAWLATACLFHIGVGVMLKIFFHHNLLAYGAFVPWMRVLHQPVHIDDRQSPSRWSRRREFLAAGLFGAVAMGWLAVNDWLPVIQNWQDFAGQLAVVAALPIVGLIAHQHWQMSREVGRCQISVSEFVP